MNVEFITAWRHLNRNYRKGDRVSCSEKRGEFLIKNKYAYNLDKNVVKKSKLNNKNKD